MTARLPRALWILVASALVVHVAVLIVAQSTIAHVIATKLTDIASYNYRAWWLASKWRQGIPANPFVLPDAVNEPGYYWVVAVVMTLFGNHPILATFVNILFACASGVLVYVVARQLFGAQVPALVAAGFVLFWPSLMMWSIVNLKDTFVIFLVVASMFLLLWRPNRWWFPLLLGTIFFFLWFTRYYDFLFVAIASAIYLFATSKAVFAARAAIAIALTMVIASFTFGVGLQTETTVFGGQLGTVAAQFSGGSTGSRTTSSTGKVEGGGGRLRKAAEGLVRALFEPFPSAHGDSLDRLAGAEDLFYYPLFAVAAYEFLQRIRRKDWWAISLFVILAGIVGVDAIVVGNVGSAFRYRAEITFWSLVLASGPLVGLWLRRKASRDSDASKTTTA